MSQPSSGIGSANAANLISLFALGASIVSLVVSCRADKYSRGVAVANRRVELVQSADALLALSRFFVDDMDRFLTESKDKMPVDDVIALTKARETAVEHNDRIKQTVKNMENWNESDPNLFAREKLDLTRSTALINRNIANFNEYRESLKKRMKEKSTPSEGSK